MMCKRTLVVPNTLVLNVCANSALVILLRIS